VPSDTTALPLFNLFSVPWPAMPSALRPFAFWKALTAAVVSLE